jgi:hypothetical protein
MALMNGLTNIVSTRGKKKSWKNGNGLHSVFGILDGQKVKVYECFNMKQLSLRWWLEDQPEFIRKYFPRIVKVEGLLVAEEFVEGRPIKTNNEMKFVRESLHTLLKQLKGWDYRHETFDYLGYICDRVDKPDPKLAHHRAYLNHNDLTTDNIVITNNGRGFVIVDNEFLACNNAGFLNVRNSDIIEEEIYDTPSDIVDKYWRIRKMYDKSLIDEHYKGKKAKSYDKGRNKNPKWAFEQKCVEKFIENHKDVSTVIDAPLGTNRFADILSGSDHIEKVYGYEYADDMILEAEKKSFPKLSIYKHDILNKRIDTPADLGLCIRMLNLFPEHESLRILDNVLQACTKYCILSIRVWDKEPELLDGKVWVQNESKFDAFIDQKGWTIDDKGYVKTSLAGMYKTFILTKDS